MKRLLILGGTGEAAALAEAAGARFGSGLEVVSSLAGRTFEPRPLPGAVRSGGFGGVEGLARYLRKEETGLLIDATHPYAARISANARLACKKTGTPRLVLERPPWTPMPGDNWISVPDISAAVDRLPGLGSRAFLSVGSGQLWRFSDIEDVWLMSRVAETPEPDTAPPGLVIVGRGPFDAVAEEKLMREHRIDILVSRNSGGEATVGKIIAARRLSIPVMMIERPAPEEGARATTIEEALVWIADKL